jgi:hypothetical protein
VADPAPEGTRAAPPADERPVEGDHAWSASARCVAPDLAALQERFGPPQPRDPLPGQPALFPLEAGTRARPPEGPEPAEAAP